MDKNQEQPVSILYRNWRGQVAVRRIIPNSIERVVWFGSTEWHPEPQWLMTAIDVDKGVSRDFALSGILAWGDKEISVRDEFFKQVTANEKQNEWKDISTSPKEDEIVVDLWMVDRSSGLEWRQSNAWRHNGHWIIVEFEEIRLIEFGDVVATHWRQVYAPSGQSTNIVKSISI